MPQLNEESTDHILQEDGSPAHYKDVRGYLNRNFEGVGDWGGGGEEIRVFQQWAP
jgi:hypothetical protein